MNLRAETHTTESETVLEMQGISKSFDLVRVLKDVSLSVRAGEVHSLVGENGAGKSTLMNIACGVLKQDAGSISIGGEYIENANAHSTRELGLSVVFQDSSLVADLTVTQNLQLELGGPKDDRLSVMNWAREILGQFDARIDPNTFVRNLSVAEKQIVEIARAVASNARILVLDEPTAALAVNEVSHLYEIVRKITAQGSAVIYITHRLPEVFELSDRVSVLRNGEMVLEGETIDNITDQQLVTQMIGRSVDMVFPARSKKPPGDLCEVLAIENLGGSGLHDVSMKIMGGQILGVFGIEGNGQRQFLRNIAGLEPRTSGAVNLDGKPVRAASVPHAVAAGISLVSSDRMGEALFPRMGIRENFTSGLLGPRSKSFYVLRQKEIDLSLRLAQQVNLAASSIEQPVGSLSGGNQQKVSVGAVMIGAPKVYLIDEPTQGVDINARAKLYGLLRKLADEGAAVVILSSDAAEIAQLCDKAVVFSRGKVVETLTSDEMDEDKLVGAAVNSQAETEASDNDQANNFANAIRQSDATPIALLLTIAVILYVIGGASFQGFSSAWTFSNILIAAIPLCLVALAQTSVMLLGELDLSVGPTMGLSTVAVVQFNAMGGNEASVILILIGVILIGAVIGAVNGFLTQVLRIAPLMATLATYILLQGVGLLWLPLQGGVVPEPISESIRTNIWVFPLPFLGILFLAIVMEYFYRRSAAGRNYRCVGSNPIAARRLGIGERRVRFLAYVASGVFGAVAGISFAASIGIGSATLANSFTLQSIAAVVLGGLSTWGGRGSVIGPVLGAMVLALIATLTSFMNAGASAQFFVSGGLTILAITLYSWLRGDAFRDAVVR